MSKMSYEKEATQKMENYCELAVHLETENRIIKLHLTESDAERAQRDEQFLQKIIHQYQINAAAAAPSGSQQQPSEAAKDSSAFIWSSSCISLLLCLYEERQHDFSQGTKRHVKIWDEISQIMIQNGHGVTGAQCQSKLNGLKKTYKKIIDHNNTTGNNRLSWPYFDRMDEIFGSSSWAKPTALATEAGPSSPVDAQRSSPKKRKHNLMEKINSEIAERQKEREERKQEWQKLKVQKIDELMHQKEKQHREKMEMMNALIQALRKEN